MTIYILKLACLTQYIQEITFNLISHDIVHQNEKNVGIAMDGIFVFTQNLFHKNPNPQCESTGS